MSLQLYRRKLEHLLYRGLPQRHTTAIMSTSADVQQASRQYYRLVSELRLLLSSSTRIPLVMSVIGASLGSDISSWRVATAQVAFLAQWVGTTAVILRVHAICGLWEETGDLLQDVLGVADMLRRVYVPALQL